MNRQLLLIILFACPVFMLAGIIPVSNLNDAGSGSLREAISQGNDGDTITFSVGGTIALDSTIRTDKDLAILGPGAADLIISGRNKKRLFWIDEDAEISFSNLTFANGNAYRDSTDDFANGGAFRNFGTLTLETCLLKDNEAGFGGAVFNSGVGTTPEDSATLYLRGCTFINNRVDPPFDNFQGTPKNGGAIGADSRSGGYAAIFAENCHFLNNYAAINGGAISMFIDRGDRRTMLSLIHCTLTGNEAGDRGGALYQEEGVNYIQNTIIAGNSSKPDNPDVHGALFSHGGTLVERIILNSSVVYRQNGGSDFLNAWPDLGPVTLQKNGLYARVPVCSSPVIGIGDSVIASDMRGFPRGQFVTLGACEPAEADRRAINLNDTGFGSLRYAIVHSCSGDTVLKINTLNGGIALKSPLIITHDVVIEGNSKQPFIIKGKGDHHLMTVENGVEAVAYFLSFNNGHSTQYGGGAIRNFGTLNLSYSSLYNNSAPSGGAIGNYGQGSVKAELELFNCTISGNQATALDGGAVENVPIDQDAKMSIRHCTIADNTANRRGGGIMNLGEATDSDVNLTIVSGNSATSGASLYGKFSSTQGHNLLDDTLQTKGSAPLGMNSIIGGNAGLYPLSGGYGGPSRCHALQANSDAIDAGLTSTTINADQRGFIRPVGPFTDIGSYEYNPITGLESEQSLSFQLYPNPAQTVLHIAHRAIDNIQLISVFDMNGKMLLSQKAELNMEVNTIDISSLRSGLYLLNLTSTSGRFSQTFIKR